MWGVLGSALTHTRPPVLGACGRGPLPIGCGCGGRGGLSRGALSCTLALRALGAGRGQPGGGLLLPGCGVSWVGRSPAPHCPSLGRAAGARYPLAAGAGVVAVGTRHQPGSARAPPSWLCALRGRHQGARGGASLALVLGRPGLGALPRHDHLSLGRAAGARYRLALGAVCGRWGVAVRATFSRAVVRRVLCALPGFEVQPCGNVTQNLNICQLIEEKCQQVGNNNLTFLCTRRTISFNSTCDANIFVQLVNVKMTTRTKTGAVMTTLVIEKMHGVLLKIWKSQGTLKN